MAYIVACDLFAIDADGSGVMFLLLLCALAGAAVVWKMTPSHSPNRSEISSNEVLNPAMHMDRARLQPQEFVQYTEHLMELHTSTASVSIVGFGSVVISPTTVVNVVVLVVAVVVAGQTPRRSSIMLCDV